MLTTTLHGESLAIEMVQANPERAGRDLIIWAGHMAFNLSSHVADGPNTEIYFKDIPYSSHRYLETVPGCAEAATREFFDRMGADEPQQTALLRRGYCVQVGRKAGIEVFRNDGVKLDAAFPESASNLVKLDAALAEVHFSISLPQPHIAKVTDLSGEYGTVIEERPQRAHGTEL